MNWLEEYQEQNKKFTEVLSFDEYLTYLKKNSTKQCRPSCQYLKDLFEHYGQDEEGGYNLFHQSEHSSPAVQGQIITQKSIYQNLINFTEEGLNNKFILLVGPNGSAKSTLVRKIMEAAENFSKTDEGALFSFSWVFPVDSYIKGSLGITSTSSSSSIETFAHLDEKEIASIITSELKDHPILLIPLEARRKLIDELLQDTPNQLETVQKSYLYNGDISKRNRMIFDALAKSYQGDYNKVFKHIRVERFTISKRYSSSAVTIEPQIHVDAKMQQITMDKRLASLPPSLQSLNLFNLQGEIIMANRGVLEFSDLLKRPLESYKYLLMTMETQSVNLQGILTELDIFFIGSSNEIHFAAFKQHPDFNSFKGRINFIKVPYLLNAEHEKNIYKTQVENLKNKTNFEPDSLKMLALWAVMTRLRHCQKKNYPSKKLGDITSTLGPLEKALFYSNNLIPERLSSEERQLLSKNVEEIKNEFLNEGLYEGKFGVSPREIKQIIYELSGQHSNITFIEIFEYLTKFIERKNEFDFLNIAQQGDFNNTTRFIEELKKYALQIFDEYVRDCLGLVDDRSYEEYITRYVQQINGLLKGEKLKNQVTGTYEESDMYFIKEFENNIKLKEDPPTFRSHMLSTLGAYSLDNPDANIVYTDVFPNLTKSLRESFREEQKKSILNLSKNIVFYESEISGPKNQLSLENRSNIQGILNNLQEKYGFTHDGALTLLKYLIKEKY